MSVNLHQSLSYLWGNNVLISSMNRVHAIDKLMVDPHAKEKDINDILSRTREAWEGVKTFFHKLKLTFLVFISESHCLTFNAASAKLITIINKVVRVAEELFHDSAESEDYSIALNSDDEEIAKEEAAAQRKEMLNKEINDLTQEIKIFEEKNNSIYMLEHYLDSSLNLAKLREENIPLIDAFDKASLELFAAEDELKKQDSKNKKDFRRVMSFRKKPVEAPQAPNEREQKVKELRETVENYRKEINDNLYKIKFNKYFELTDEQLKAKTKELTSLIAQRKELGKRLRQKETELSELD